MSMAVIIKIMTTVQRKARTPFGKVPVMEVDGVTVAGSSNILRYIGKVVNLIYYLILTAD